MADFLERHKQQKVIAPPYNFFSKRGCKTYDEYSTTSGYDFFVVHKPIFCALGKQQLKEFIDKSELVWANAIFYVFARKHWYYNPFKAQTLRETMLSWKKEVNSRFEEIEKEAMLPKKLVFVHIFKSGGRSLYASLRRHYRRQVYLRNNYIYCPTLKYREANFLAGHIEFYNFQKILKKSPCTWLTLLRNPKERILSDLAHNRRERGDSDANLQLSQNHLDSDTLNSKRWFILCSCSLQMLADLPPQELNHENAGTYFDSAVEVLHRDDVIPGILEEMPAYISLLEQALGLSLAMEKKNVATNYDQISTAEQEFVANYNSPVLEFEFKLYNVAKVRFNELAGNRIIRNNHHDNLSQTGLQSLYHQ